MVPLSFSVSQFLYYSKFEFQAWESRLKIKGAFCVLDRHGLDGVRVDHGGSQIAMPQQLLNRADIIIGLEQMAGKAVAECMG